MLEKVSRWCLFWFKNEVFYDHRIKKRLKNVTVVNIQGCGVRESGANPELCPQR